VLSVSQSRSPFDNGMRWRNPETGNIGQGHDYLNDLNAMHEAEKVLTAKQKGRYAHLLTGSCGRAWDATATQRAQAFLKTLGLWKES